MLKLISPTYWSSLSGNKIYMQDLSLFLIDFKNFPEDGKSNMAGF